MKVNNSQIAVKGAFWFFSSSSIQNGILLILSIVLARLLTPADFGVVMVVLAIQVILQVFSEFGVSIAIVQRKDINDTVIDSAFSCVVFFTMFVSLLIFFLAPFLASFYNTEQLLGLMRWSAVTYVFIGLSSLQTCLLQRSLKFKQISFINVCNHLVYGFVTVIFAVKHYGPHSIIFGKIVASVLSLIIGYQFTRYLPKSFGSFLEAKQLLAFGIWVSVGRVLATSSARFDTFFIGKILDMSSVGAFNLAHRMVTFFPALLNGVYDKVLFPIYSRSQDNKAKIEDNFWESLMITSLVSLPFPILVIIFADFIVLLFFGQKWSNITVLVRLMSIYSIFITCGGGIISSLVFSSGKPHIKTVLNLFRVVVMPAFICFGSMWHLTGVALSFGLYGFVDRLFGQLLVTHYYSFSIYKFIKISGVVFFVNSIPSALVFFLYHIIGVHHSLNWRVAVVAFLIIVWFALYYLVLKIVLPSRLSKIVFLLKSICKR